MSSRGIGMRCAEGDKKPGALSSHWSAVSWAKAVAAALACAALLCLSAAGAKAEVIVQLAGAGSGKVASSPAGIECSNIPSESAADCSESYPLEESPGVPNVISLTPTPGPGSVFSGWQGNDAFGFFFGAESCNAGNAEPCLVVDSSIAMEGAPVTITATFGCAPPVQAPTASTGGARAGSSAALVELEGSVNPNGCGLEQCRFEFGETTAYGQSSPCVPGAEAIGAGSADVPVSASTEPLEPETEYHYRLVVSGNGGQSVGQDQTFVTGPLSPDGCLNADRRREQGAAVRLLPDCMAVEMVSPPEKYVQAAKAPSVSADGERVRFLSLAALADTPGLLSPFGDAYIATREGDGWSASPTTPPAGFVQGAPARNSIAAPLSLSPDYRQWFQIASTEPQYNLGEAQAFHADLSGSFEAVSPLLQPQGGGGPANVANAGQFQGASADRSHFVFRPGESGVRYLPGDPLPVGGDENTYVAHREGAGSPSLELLARDKTGAVWGDRCGARLGGIGGAGVGARNQGAVAANGSRIYFSTRPGQPSGSECKPSLHALRILERLETPEGPSIGELIQSECDRELPAPPCSTTDGDDFYQGASLDQTKVYFTTNRQLADSDLDDGPSCSPQPGASIGCDLYLYDSSLPVGERLIQVSAGESGTGANVLNAITGISGDGSHVYFVAEGVLTADPNAEGDAAQGGQLNLYAWEREDESTTFIGALAVSDRTDEVGGGLWGGSGSYRNAAYPVPARGAAGDGGDGSTLVFHSAAALTNDDDDGSRRDVFRYDVDTGALECLSCVEGPGAADVEPRPNFQEAPGTDFAEEFRWVSESGQTVSFVTAEGLAPGDTNGVTDSYLWRDGRLVRLPGTTDASGKLNDRPSLSHDGSVVAFTTFLPLVPMDGDTAVDVYVAGVGGGFKPPDPPADCSPGDGGCQGIAPRPPVGGLAGSQAFAGGGNPAPSCRHFSRRAKKLRSRAKSLRKVAKQAPKGKRRAKAVKKATQLGKKAKRLDRKAKRCRRIEGRTAR
jgi:hypothetical protein